MANTPRSDEKARELGLLLRKFAKLGGISPAEFVDAVGWSSGHSGPKHLKERWRGLCAKIISANLKDIPRKPELFREQDYAEVDRLRNRVKELVHGQPEPDPPDLPLVMDKEWALEMGRSALVAHRVGEITLAEWRASQAYSYLMDNPISPYELGYHLWLQTATILGHLYTGLRADPAMAVAKLNRLAEVATAYDEDDRSVNLAIAQLNRQLSNSRREAGLDIRLASLQMEDALKRVKKCRVKTNKFDPTLSDHVGMLLDRACLHLQQAYRYHEPSLVPSQLDQMCMRLDQAIALAGRFPLDEPACHLWLYAKLFQTSCLAMARKLPDAERALEEALQKEWTACMIEKEPIPFVAELGLAELRLEYARASATLRKGKAPELAAVEEAAQKIIRSEHNASAGLARRRAREALRLAAAGELQGIRTALLP